LAELDRRRERRLREIEGELGYCRERAQYYHQRIERLERAQAELTAEEAPPAAEEGAAPAGTAGGLAELVKSLNPETLKQIGEAVQGLDLRPILGALGAGGGAGGGGGGAPALGGLAGLLGGGGTAPAGSALDGISEVMGWLEKNPLKGQRWGMKEILGAMQLVRSPNVRALLAGAATAANLARAGSKSVPLLSSLLSGGNAPKGAAKPEAVAVPGEGPAAESAAPPEPPRQIRVRRSEGPPPVVEPWGGGPAGRWEWVPESGGAA
jgi:hypothetical protein